ncbi:MAG TPA: 50S ribosomal protein L13 [Patescibacteria group bacterium]|nr:50S ribosomal protein L13 [Patescibacteria group bacterium]
MNTKINREQHEIDATGLVLGRLASKIASLLNGKTKPDFDPSRDTGDFVTVTNAAKVKITGRKLVQKDYYKHTMHPGGLKVMPMKRLMEKNPAEVLRRTVYGMLPKNRLRVLKMKRLIVKA